MSKWSRNNYPVRGVRKSRCKIVEASITGECIICGATLIRKEGKNKVGKITIEPWGRLSIRKTCGMLPNERGELKIKSKCLKEMAKEDRNGNYKGIMHIQCSVCKKQGLSYRNKDEKYDMCIDCWNKNRPESPFKEDLKNIECLRCGKEISARWECGQKRYGKSFCSKKCANNTRDLKRIKIECVVCKKEMLVIPYLSKKKKTCSLSCNGKLGGEAHKIWIKENIDLYRKKRKASRKGRYNTCKICRNKYYIFPSQKKRNYCSVECLSKSNRAEIECKKCYKLFSVPKCYKDRFKNCKECRKDK